MMRIREASTKQKVLVLLLLVLATGFVSMLFELRVETTHHLINNEIQDSYSEEIDTGQPDVDDDNNNGEVVAYVLSRSSTRPYNESLDPKTKYFTYSPSGGFNNQRIEMEYAMIIAKILGRTLIVPPMGKHTSFYGRYELLLPQQLVAMDKIFDFELMSKFVPVISMGNQLILTYIKRLEETNNVRTLFHTERKNWQEAEVRGHLSLLKDQVIFLRGKEMYHDWNFNIPMSRIKYTHVRFTEGIRQIAFQIIQNTFRETNGKFNAIHVRVGDYKDKVPPTSEYLKKMKNDHFKRDVPLYIATEPSTPRFMFREICAPSGAYNCVFSKDLDPPTLRSYSLGVPSGQIRHDMIGVIEQLVCVGAAKFHGTWYSTFSAKIQVMRSFRRIAFPEMDTNSSTSEAEVDYSDGGEYQGTENAN